MPKKKTVKAVEPPAAKIPVPRVRAEEGKLLTFDEFKSLTQTGQRELAIYAALLQLINK